MFCGFQREHDVEAATAKAVSASSTGSRFIRAFQEYFSSKCSTNTIGRESPGPVGKSVPEIRDLTTSTRILRNLVAADNVDGVKDLLDAMQADQKSDGFTIQNADGDGLLQMAALNGYGPMTQLLLDKGFDINYVDDNHGTALQAAIYMGSEEVIKILFEHESLNANTAGGYYGCALQVAAFKGSLKNIEKLVEHGVHQDIFIAKSKYGSALQAAARTGSPRVLERILKLKPCQINAFGGAWGTALQAAAKGDYTAATAKLRHLSRGRVLEQSSEKYRKSGNESIDYLQVAQLLIDNGAEIDVENGGRLQTPINAAASSGQVEMLGLLLKANKSPDNLERKEKYGRALLSAITQTRAGRESGNLTVQKRINRNRLKLVKLLLKHGANIKFTAGHCLYNRPLAAAAAMNDVEVLRALLGEESDQHANTDQAKESKVQKEKIQLQQLNEVSGIYGSVLRSALCAIPPAREVAHYLIKKGVNTIDGDEQYGNVLHLAAFANLPDVLDKLLDGNKQDINVSDRNGQTALHIAAYRGYENVVDKLLTKGALTNLKDVWGDIPLDIVGGVIARESHPVPSLQGLRKIRELLLTKTVPEAEPASGIFRGPGLPKELQPREQHPAAKPVYELPNWNPGLQFHAKIVDFLKHDQQEYVNIKDLPIDDLLYQKDAIDTVMYTPDAAYQRKLRWIHLPTNNMTWAEMLMKILWSKQHEGTVCKSIWGTDPYFVSPDLAPHARFVTPQCGPLIKESTFLPHLPRRSICKSTLFFAMPYIHWESFSSQEELSNILHKVIRDISKTKIWRSNDKTGQSSEAPSRQTTVELDEPSPSPGGDDGVPGADNPKSTDYDEELLKVYHSLQLDLRHGLWCLPKDMKDELNMLSAVFNDQKDVLKKVGKNIETSRESLLVKAREVLSKVQQSEKNQAAKQPEEKQSAHTIGKDPKTNLENETTASDHAAEKIAAEAFVETRLSAFIFQQQSDKHASHIKRMQDQAKQAYTNLQDLLNFKQQQANVLGARVNRNLTITAKEQNKIILVFTIVTIIFLPLSFITTVFTLPILEFPWYDQATRKPDNENGARLKQNYVFSITFGFTVILAFFPIMAAFKVRLLQSAWKRMKRFRLKVIPIHMAGKKEIPEPEKEDGEKGKLLFWRFYWGGPEPHRHDELNSL